MDIESWVPLMVKWSKKREIIGRIVVVDDKSINALYSHEFDPLNNEMNAIRCCGAYC